MTEALMCLGLVVLTAAVVASWQVGRWLLCHELRLEMLEEVEVRKQVLPIGQGRPNLSIAETGDGPDLAA